MTSRYTHGCPGWVALRTREHDGKTHHFWWHGPSRMFTATGALDAHAVVYPTRAALVVAMREAGVTGLTPQKVADAEAMNVDRWAAWWEQVCQEAGVKPDNRLPDQTIANRWARRTGSIPSAEQIAEYRACWTYARSFVTKGSPS